MRSERAYVGLGANIGEPRVNLARAVRALAALPDTRLVDVSALYRTRPVGVLDQPDFLNAVAALEVPAGPDPETGALALLAALKSLELSLGRRSGGRWGPREVDLDLLLFGDHVVSAERPDGRWLEVPHPQMAHRLFVLQPLAEMAPDLLPARWTLTVGQAAQQQRALEGEAAVRYEAAWDRVASDWVG